MVYAATMIKRTYALAILLAACGGSQKSAPAPAPEVAKVEPSKAVGDFHDVLAPLWHADPGPQRTDDTCKQAPQMVALADVVATSAEPAWADKAAGLQASTKALADDCQHGRAGFDAKFHDVHEAFHQVAEVVHAH